MIGQDEQQPRKERKPHVSNPPDHDAAAVSDVDEIAVTVDMPSDAEEDTGVEELPLDLDNIRLTETPNDNVTDNVTDWTWND